MRLKRDYGRFRPIGLGNSITCGGHPVLCSVWDESVIDLTLGQTPPGLVPVVPAFLHYKRRTRSAQALEPPRQVGWRLFNQSEVQ